MNLKFFVYDRDRRDSLPIARMFLYYPETRNQLLSYDYWFFLYNEENEVVAECGVKRCGAILPCWTRKDCTLEISDVWVRESKRGQNICSLLLMNVLYYFDQNLDREHRVRLWAHRRNRAALRAYRKVFGRPTGPFGKGLMEFSTQHPETRRN